MFLIQALALPAAKLFAQAWTWLYTLAAPRDQREARRAEMWSDLYEHVSDWRQEGFGPAAIALHIVIRMACGLPDDLRWTAASCTPMMLVEKLERGSETLGRLSLPVQAIITIAFFAFMNLIYFTSDDLAWRNALSINTSILFGSILAWKERHLWVRRLTRLMYVLAVVLGSCFFLWVVIQHRLYQFPFFHQMMLAMVPVVLAFVVSDRTIRRRFFGGRWWPVVTCWSLIVPVSIILANMLNFLQIQLMIWGFVILLSVTLIIAMAICMVFAFGIAIIWCSGVAVSVRSMRLIAIGLRRLM